MRRCRRSNSQSLPPNRTFETFSLSQCRRLALIPSTRSPTVALPPLPSVVASPIDLLSILLAKQLAYKSTERDMVVLHHELGTTTSEGDKELLTSTMIQYGTPGGDSAMAKTVGMVSLSPLFSRCLLTRAIGSQSLWELFSLSMGRLKHEESSVLRPLRFGNRFCKSWNERESV